MRILARKQLAVGELRLAPWTPSVQAKPVESKDDCRVYAQVMTKPPKIFAIGAPSLQNVEIPFWRMQEEKKEMKFSNVKWEVRTFGVQWPIDIGMGSKTVDVEIKCAVNSKIIKLNNEIRLWNPKGKRGSEAAMTISMDTIVNDASKKRRTA